MIKVVVPATSANMGPGFDSLGVALNIYNTFIFEKSNESIEIIGCEPQFSNDNNLVYKSFMETLHIIGSPLQNPGIKITIDSKIPISRGLGSSSTCIVAGVVAANRLSGNPLTQEEVLKIATEIEGHPDNVAPALFGGVAVSVLEDGKVYYNEVNVSRGLKFIALIPDFTLSTKEARAVLPETVSLKDAVFNVSRAALLLSALSNGNFELLKVGLNDKLHQQYRGELIPDFHFIFNKCEELGSLGTYLSGAGPTIMTLIQDNNPVFVEKIQESLKSLSNKWTIKELSIDKKGTFIIED